MGFLDNAWKDVKGAVDPRNYIKAGSTLIHHPLGFAKAVGQQYVDLAEHPIRSFENHPINTLLELAPLTKVAEFGGIGRAIASSTERGAAKEALIKAATRDSGHGGGLSSPSQAVSTSERFTPLTGGELLNHHISGSFDSPVPANKTAFGLSHTEYQPKPVVNEGPASLGDVMSKRRELFDFQTEGNAAAKAAADTHTPLEGLSPQSLERMMEDAHARGNLKRGDQLANHIMSRHGYDPYQEFAPTHSPSRPPKGAPSWMAPYSMPKHLGGDKQPMQEAIGSANLVRRHGVDRTASNRIYKNNSFAAQNKVFGSYKEDPLARKMSPSARRQDALMKMLRNQSHN